MLIILSTDLRKRLTIRAPYPRSTLGRRLLCRWVFRGDPVPKVRLWPRESSTCDLCPDFDLAKAELATREFFLPEIPQAVFCAMLLNDAVRQWVLSGGLIEILESALVELRWSTIEEWVSRNRGSILQAATQSYIVIRKRLLSLAMHLPLPVTFLEREISFLERDSALFSITVFPYFLSTEEMANHIRKTFNWHLKRVTCPSQSLSENYHDLCLDFILFDKTPHDFHIPEMIQAVFYTMVVNEALELGILSKNLAEHLRSALEGLWWFIFEAWRQLNKHALLCAHHHGQVDPRVRPGPVGGQGESSGLSDALPPSSDVE
ncbi:LOW QUALITY PROTEIN: hypothetical protein Cgig2_012365 [Carnegiea gigantea]|uniref:Uncharacterized protein n=1 Tax=Carnegiea gigantea TaxID=171969 RepID=A0A9Q1KKB4_9CARY|nr:LOW QUALITY PROTEIN: hypothetical protein Cgig2_012365 [Carnegiea gigantea]